MTVANQTTYQFVTVRTQIYNLNKFEIKFGEIKIIEKGQLSINYNEIEVAEYMKNEKIDLFIDIQTGKKNFSAYTMDLTTKYIEINSDYRS